MKNTIGQIEASIDNNELDHYLTEEEFKDYCDSAYTCITYLKVIERRKKMG